jgi:enterochelin esterase-like enzyme
LARLSIFDRMQMDTSIDVLVESVTLPSEPLERDVRVDFYLPTNVSRPDELNLLFINDGQDLVTMGFEKMLAQLYSNRQMSPVLCIGIHCGEDRKNEYGMLVSPDFKGRGAKAGLYQKFILEELFPLLYSRYNLRDSNEKAFAGFSLGGLSALDISWNNPALFSRVGVFSGSLWWRSKSKDDRDYNEATDRLMHKQVRETKERPNLQFFFQCGELDETEDRNKNGVIDSIDDTIDLLRELLAKGYLEGRDFRYLQIPDGRHDVPTWARALPEFLKWGWPPKN